MLGVFSLLLGVHVNNVTFYLESCQDTAEVELIAEREDIQPDSPLDDTVSVTLRRENSIRHSKRNGRSEHSDVLGEKWMTVCVCLCVGGGVGGFTMHTDGSV